MTAITKQTLDCGCILESSDNYDADLYVSEWTPCSEKHREILVRINAKVKEKE